MVKIKVCTLLSLFTYLSKLWTISKTGNVQILKSFIQQPNNKKHQNRSIYIYYILEIGQVGHLCEFKFIRKINKNRFELSSLQQCTLIALYYRPLTAHIAIRSSEF